MSEEKKERAITEIQQEYSGTCTRAGHIRYQIDALEKDLDMVLSNLRDLNFEALAVQKAEVDKKQAETPTAKEEGIS